MDIHTLSAHGITCSEHTSLHTKRSMFQLCAKTQFEHTYMYAVHCWCLNEKMSYLQLGDRQFSLFYSMIEADDDLNKRCAIRKISVFILYRITSIKRPFLLNAPPPLFQDLKNKRPPRINAPPPPQRGRLFKTLCYFPGKNMFIPCLSLDIVEAAPSFNHRRRK